MNKFTSVILLLLLSVSTSVLADKYSRALDVFQENPETKAFFPKSEAYAIFPTISKGGIGVGGAFGKGRVYQGDKLLGTTDVVQLSVGFQFGGQAYSQIVFFKDQRALDEFTQGEFKLGAEASAVAITASASAQAGTAGTSTSAGIGQEDTEVTGSWHKGIAIFTVAKGGLFYQAAVAGQKFGFEPIEAQTRESDDQ